MSQVQGQQFQTPINIASIDLPNSGGYFEEEGVYKMIVQKAEFKSAKNNQANSMLALTLKCIEGVHNGKTGTHNLNLYNQNPDAARIAFSELAAYVTAMGADPMLQNTAQLCGKPFFVYVSVTESPSKNDPNKTYKNNNYSDWAYADGTPIVKNQFGATQGAAQGQTYASPQAVAPQVAPVAPQAAAQPQYAPQATQAAAVQPQQQQYAPQTAPQAVAPQVAPVQQQPQYAPQAAAPQVAPAQQFAPQAAAPFAPPQG